MAKCYKCGAPALKEGLCEEHYAEAWIKEITKKVEEKLKKMKIVVCPRCGRVLYHNKWQKKSFEEIIKSAIKNDVKGGVIEVGKNNLRIILSLNNMKKIIEINLPKMHKVLCRDCSLAGSGYYEAVIQIRGNAPEKIINAVESDKNVVKVVNVKGGADFYFLSKSAAERVAWALKKSGYNVKSSYKLVTRKDGRDVYRAYFIIRF
jgi:NMD protein affecting ribosome stability and mRNA decay